MRFLSLTMAVTLAGCSDSGSPQGGDAGTEGSGTNTESVSNGDSASDPSASSAGPTSSPSTSPTATATEGTTTDPSPTGGSSETTDSGGTSGTMCVEDADCEVLSDCCVCTAKHVDDEPPVCDDVACFAPFCEANGIGDIGVECRFGVCQLEELTCDQTPVTCEAPTPDCQEGYLPLVDGDCWAGNCVPAEACDVVPDCTWCDDDQTCVEFESGFSSFFTCEPIPEACGGTPTCACMSEACDVENYETCADTPDGISCQCIAC